MAFDQCAFSQNLPHARTESGEVPQLVLLVRSDLAQNATHDLARASLRERMREDDIVGGRERADDLRKNG